MREMSKGKENFALSDGNVFKYFLYIFLYKGIESLPQTLVFFSLYICKPSVVDLIYFKL